MSSRLATDAKGRLIVVVTSSCEVGLQAGERFLCIGNEVRAGAGGPVFAFVGETSARPPTRAEQLGLPEARPAQKPLPPVDDELLDTETAIEAARLEQQRTPADLLTAA